MTMKNPPHPGGLIRREVIEPLGLSVSDAAEILGVSRQSVSLLWVLIAVTLWGNKNLPKRISELFFQSSLFQDFIGCMA